MKLEQLVVSTIETLAQAEMLVVYAVEIAGGALIVLL